MEITYKARSYFVQKIEQETEEALASRSWFIIKALDPSTSVVSAISNSNPNPNTNLSSPNFTSDVPITFDEAVLLSKYWYYVRKYDCKYNQSIMEKIMKVEKLLYV